MEQQLKNSIKMALVFGLVSFLGIATPRTVFGDEGANPFGSIRPLLGLDLGVASYNNSVGTKFTYGGRAAARMGDLELGLAYRKAKLASDDATSTSVDLTYILGQFDYRMAAGGGTFTVGLEAGSGKLTTNLNLGIFSLEGSSEEKFAFGPRVGYQIPLSPHWEIGASVDYLTVLTSDKIHSFGFLADAAYVF